MEAISLEGRPEGTSPRAQGQARYNCPVQLPYRASGPPTAAAAAGVLCLLWLLSSALGARPNPALPSELPEPDRTRLQAIADRADVSTRMEAEPFMVRADVFEYLLDHPDFASHVTRTLRLARYRIWRTAEGLFLDDGWGATGQFWIVYVGPGKRVMRARGEYRKGVMPSIQGDAVTMIEYGFTPATDGKSLVRSTVTGFLKLDSRMVALAMKVASTVAQRKADVEANRLMRVFARVSRALDEDPAGVLDQLQQRPDVPPRELEEFRRLLLGR